MKPGLRLQVLLLLGALLVVGFVPLFFAIEAYLEVALTQARRESSRALGRTVAAYVIEGARTRAPSGLSELLDAQISQDGVLAIAVYGASGERLAVAGKPSALALLPPQTPPGHDALEEFALERRRVVRVTVAGASHNISTLISQLEPRVSVLTRLLALYMTLIGVLLLATAYLTLTRWIVTPVSQLSRAAQRVASTTRPLELPSMRSRELSDLATSLKVMTEKLLHEERALRKKVEEVEEATAQLTATQAQLLHSERMASVGQLAAGLAHEVGNPIAAMMGMQDLILEGGLSPAEQTDFIQRMRKETERIHRILRDLLDFARPTSADEEEAEPGSVETSINETISLLMPQPSLRDVDIVLDVYPDLPRVRLPQGQITQVLLNLLLNAAAACERGGTVRVSARLVGSHVEVSVEDDGPGVKPELADRIFEPFVSSKDVGEGSGLGLSVCRGLIESVGGSIALDLNHSPGARFVVQLSVYEERSSLAPH